jgi:CRISPR system Cascade subunit CasC
MRQYFKAAKLVDEAHLAVRTKRVTQALAAVLVRQGRPVVEAEHIGAVALGGLQLTVADGKTQYLLYLGQREIEGIASLIDRHWDELSEVGTEKAGVGKKAREAKKAAKEAVAADVAAAMKAALDGGRAVDLALFGRMLADLPDLNMDAAAQVAHAVSTHRVDREFDFYTAVDDLKPQDTQGADMLGTVEFNSACYYRYTVVDLRTLRKNLQDDTELATRGLEGFLRASVYAVPGGKQNTFAAHNPPGFVAFVVRRDASPRSLANAFEIPVRAGELGLTAASVQALAREWARLDSVFGQAGETTYINVTDATPEGLPGIQAESIDALVAATMKHVQAHWEN